MQSGRASCICSLCGHTGPRTYKVPALFNPDGNGGRHLEIHCGFWTKSPAFSFCSGPGGSGGKILCLQCWKPGFNPWVGKIPWRRKRQPPPVFLPGKFHGWRNLVGYSPGGSKSRTRLSGFACAGLRETSDREPNTRGLKAVWNLKQARKSERASRRNLCNTGRAAVAEVMEERVTQH